MLRQCPVLQDGAERVVAGRRVREARAAVAAVCAAAAAQPASLAKLPLERFSAWPRRMWVKNFFLELARPRVFCWSRRCRWLSNRENPASAAGS
jgi:hypothetical protein